MSSWTQPICDNCWNLNFPDREPVRMEAPMVEIETCCACAARTRSGIYVRRDPRTVQFPNQRRPKEWPTSVEVTSERADDKDLEELVAMGFRPDEVRQPLAQARATGEADPVGYVVRSLIRTRSK